MPKTNAARLLDSAGVNYDLRTYDVDEEDLSASTAAEKLGLDIASVFKTLVARSSTNEVLLACIPADTQLDGKALGSASGAKRAELVPLAEVQGLTGYVRGGVSPRGTKKPYRLFIDETAHGQPRISVSAGLRGLQIIISPDDLVKVANAAVVPISRRVL